MDGLTLPRYAHFLGVIFWIGGTVTVALAAAYASDADRAGTVRALRVTVSRFVTPGLILAWLGGLGMLLPNFSTLYARAGWMHGKLTLVLIATGLSGVIGGRLRRAAAGNGSVAPGVMRNLGLAVLAITILVVGLAVLRPGS